MAADRLPQHCDPSATCRAVQGPKVNDVLFDFAGAGIQDHWLRVRIVEVEHVI